MNSSHSGIVARSLIAWLALFSLCAAGEVRLNGRTFQVPEGFTIELIAGPPLVDRPIVADFDDQGRLYVADSSGSNDPVEKQLIEKPHRVLRLEDSDGDGKFDTRTVFADKMMFPEGAMWRDGSLYVSAPPSIWKLTDSNRDGVADLREEWFQGRTLTGCANDLHGPYPGPDGWIYWCKGAFAKQRYERPGKSPLVTRAAHIFRARPDGTSVEPVMTGGMDNPVDVVFTPGGERIFTTTFLQHPGGGRRDGLIHAVYGGVYGKMHDVIESHQRTSPDVMPVLSHLGPAAPCGLARYESEVFGVEYRDNLFATLFNLHKVSRHILEPAGASFKSEDKDFLTCSDLDFHPTDIHEDADGSLVVIDTGGWYKLCCPTSQLHKPDVLGAIYRIRKTGAPAVADPRGQNINWGILPSEALTDLLGDRRPAVRRRAIAALSERGPAAFASLTKVLERGTTEARRNALWTLCRIDHSNARLLTSVSLQGDRSESVRQVALHSISLWRDKRALPVLVATLQNRTVANQRAAAEAIGRIGNRAAVPALLAASDKARDPFLIHSLIFALIEIADPQGTSKGLQTDQAGVKRAALIALDQMENSKLTVDQLSPYLTSSDASLKEAAVWIAGRHPEWGEALAGYLQKRLETEPLADNEKAEIETQFAQFARGSKAVQELLAAKVTDESTPVATRLIALHAMATAAPKPAPSTWLKSLIPALSSQAAQVRKQAVATTRALPIAKGQGGDIQAALSKLANDETGDADLRLGALAAAPGGPGELTTPVFNFVRSQLSPDNPVSRRSMAADVLSRSALTHDQLLELAASVRSAGPFELDRLISGYEKSSDNVAGLALVAALKNSQALASLRTENLKPRLKSFGEEVQKEAEGLYATLNANAAGERAKLESLLSTISGGDVRRGQSVFNGNKAACSTCHAIGYLGGKVGPDLTRIGGVRSERDLLESIVFPSASFVRSYEPVIVATKEGKVHSGILKRDSDEVVLATNATEEVRISRSDIEEMKPGTVSIMPAGLDQQLSPQDLADLVAFLKASR
jgi:putative membrane-bound dehydrogenase-like protein